MGKSRKKTNPGAALIGMGFAIGAVLAFNVASKGITGPATMAVTVVGFGIAALLCVIGAIQLNR